MAQRLLWFPMFPDVHSKLESSLQSRPTNTGRNDIFVSCLFVMATFVSCYPSRAVCKSPCRFTNSRPRLTWACLVSYERESGLTYTRSRLHHAIRARHEGGPGLIPNRAGLLECTLAGPHCCTVFGRIAVRVSEVLHRRNNPRIGGPSPVGDWLLAPIRLRSGSDPTDCSVDPIARCASVPMVFNSEKLAPAM